MVLTNNGKPDVNQYLLGRGHIYLDLFDASTDLPIYMMRHLGNATGFTLTTEEEVIEHFSSRSGLKKTDASATLSKSLKGTMTLDELSPENIALFGSADEPTPVTQQAEAFQYDVYIPANAGGSYIQIWKNAESTATKQGTIPAQGINPDLTFYLDSTEGSSTGTVYDNVLDYTLDAARGVIYIVPGGALATSETWVYANGTHLAKTLREVRLLNRTVVRGRLTFVNENAATNEKRTLILNKVKMQASGDLQFISNEWASMAIEFTAEEDATNFPLSPVGSLHVAQA